MDDYERLDWWGRENRDKPIVIILEWRGLKKYTFYTKDYGRKIKKDSRITQ